MPDLPLAPKEIEVRCPTDQEGDDVTFFLRPPPKTEVADSVANSVLQQQMIEQGEETGRPAGRRGRLLRLQDEQVRELICYCYLRAQTDGGEPLTIGGEPFDPQTDEHYLALPDLWIAQVIAELKMYGLRMPQGFVGNFKAPDEESHEDMKSSPDSAGASEPSSAATSG